MQIGWNAALMGGLKNAAHIVSTCNCGGAFPTHYINIFSNATVMKLRANASFLNAAFQRTCVNASFSVHGVSMHDNGRA